MTNLISACTDETILQSFMPLAYLQFHPSQSGNNNVAQFDLRWKVRLHFNRGGCLVRNLAQ
jgi:hypothetical protein